MLRRPVVSLSCKHPDFAEPNMAIASFRPKVFVSYAHEDRELKRKFDVNLNVLKKQGIIDLWTDGEIQPGDCWSTEISKAMSEAHLILFLVSNHFINSTFISEVEAPMAMERQENRQAVIIPIILNKTPGWQEEAWSGLQALPNPDKPLEDWKSYESGFAEVEEQLRKFIKNVLPKRIELPKKKQDEEAPEIRNPRAFSAVPDKTSASTRPLRKLRWPGLAALILLFGFAGWMMPKRDAAPPGSDSGNDKAAKSTVTPASADAGISSELMEWLHDPKVNDQKVRVLVPKGRELYSKNGLVAAGAEPILVHAHRIEELSWEESGTRLVARNGLKWDMAITDANGSQIHEDLSLTTFFDAAEPGKSTKGRRIVVDPSRQVGFRSAGGVDAPPGFAFANTSGGRTAEMLGQHVFSPAFFTGPTGRIDAGDHLVAYELKMGGQPVRRGLLNLVVPSAVSGLSRQEWLEAVPKLGFEVCLEPGGVIWPKKNELACELRVKGDPARLKAPVKWLCYYQAGKVGDGKPESWVVDPDGMSSLERSVELRDFNWRHACWSDGGELLLKEGVAKEVIKLPAGPLGEFKAGRRDVAVELLGGW